MLMKIVPQQESYLREAVRDELALNPLITVRQLQRSMPLRNGRMISDKYLMRLLHKVRREIVFQSDRRKVSARLTEVSERYATLKRNACFSSHIGDQNTTRTTKLTDQKSGRGLRPDVQ